MTAPAHDGSFPGAVWPGRGRPDGGRRVLFYSHDTFGLGHLRRARTLASALTSRDESLSALILTGSPIAGRFDFPDRVDHVRLPGVVKLADGDYASHNLGMPIDETVRLRAAIIEATEQAFDPELLIVDKEAWGFRNEMAGALAAARRRGARIVLGVRDVLDDPRHLAEEWRRKGHAEAIRRYFDEIWVYGLPEVCRPLEGLDLDSDVLDRVVYTGYLRRDAPDWPSDVGLAPPDKPYVLVTTGGGGDGEGLVDWTLSAYEADLTLAPHAVIVYGPFLHAEKRAEFDRRALALKGRVTALSFDSRIERLLAESAGIIAMGGYNTFCEILSLDKPAVIAPRTRPRLEQYIRAEAAERLGLARMLLPERDGRGPEAMAAAIRGLADQPPPSAVRIPGLLDGLEGVAERAAKAFGAARRNAARRAAG
ncbi:glycosyltransferase [Albimonas sp. CAU 1670]|uniref:glycosyltransferase family protein n=1 Tax=Albimonas sp. CAU 1670 TaxID=3032599 RepID=UPI0031F46540